MEKGVKPKTQKKPVKKTRKPINKENVAVDKPLPQVKCRFCQESYAEGLSICPFCRRRNRGDNGVVLVFILVIVFLLAIIFSHFVEKRNREQISESDYKYNCQLVDYERLVRNSSDFKGQDVKIIGKVILVEGTDLGYGNNMLVTLDINLFDGVNEQIVVFEYLDKDYSAGLITDDIITVYGKYTALNGNTPYLKAKYLVFGT